MKIAIVGAGAIGSLLGGILARAGEEVTLVGRRAHMQAIRENGLWVDGVMGEFQVEVKTAEKLAFKPEMIFLTSKTQDVERLCHLILPYAGGIPIIITQNGIHSTTIASSILEKDQIIGCILLLNARFMSLGKVTYVNKSPIIIGEVFSQNGSRIKTVQSLLSNVAETYITNNIIGAQWTKLFINAMSNSLDGLTGLRLHEIIEHPVLIAIGVHVLKEAMQVFEETGIKLEKLPGVPISLFKMLLKTPTPLAGFILKRMMKAKGDPDIMTSTLQSLKKGNRTEIDYLNGEFVALGEQVQTPTPYNSKVVELVHQVEKSQRFFTPQELEAIFLSDKSWNSAFHQ